MLGEDKKPGHAPEPVLSVVREMLARNIAARNPDIEPGQFSPVVIRVLFALTAARIFESRGCSRGPALNDILREQGLLNGLSSFFSVPGSRQGPDLSGSPAVPGEPEPLFMFPDFVIDEKIVEKVVTLTSGPGFVNEQDSYRSETGMDFWEAFLGKQVRLSSSNRMVIEETAWTLNRSGPGPLPGTCLHGIYDKVLDGMLSGKSPVSGDAIRILDPCCGNGRSLCATFSRLVGWHKAWYGAHLVPQIGKGKDPSSRSVQQVIPKPFPGTGSPGFSPLPVCEAGNGDLSLTWREKARILAGSVFGLDGDPQAVMVTRLVLLSVFLDDLNYPCTESFRPDLIIRILCGNVRYRDGSLTGTNPVPPSDTEPTWQPWEGNGSRPGILFPGIAPEGGFDLVICPVCRPPGRTGDNTRNTPAGSRRAGNRSPDPEPACIRSGMSMLKKGGMYCGTGTGRWLRAPGASRFREWLAAFQVHEIVTFRLPPDSERGEVPPVVVSIINAPAARPFTVAIAGEVCGSGEGGYGRLFSREVGQGTLSHKPWLFFEVSPERLRNLVKGRGSPLSQVLLGEYFRSGAKAPSGLVIGKEAADRALKKDPVMRSFLLPLVCSRDISPYSPVQAARYLVVMPEGTTARLSGKHGDPASWFSSHHTTFFTMFNEAPRAGDEPALRKEGCFWEWKGPDPPRFLHGPVLLFSRGTGTSLPGWTLAPGGAYPGPGVIALPARDLSLLGILNSTVFWSYMLSSGPGNGTTGKRDKQIPEFPEKGIPEFPLYIPDPESREEMAIQSDINRLVKLRLALGHEPWSATPGTGQGLTRDGAPGPEREIDRCVCRLYGISEKDCGEAGYLVSLYRRRFTDTGIGQIENPDSPS
jgi:hypothetical protein